MPKITPFILLVFLIGCSKDENDPSAHFPSGVYSVYGNDQPTTAPLSGGRPVGRIIVNGSVVLEQDYGGASGKANFKITNGSLQREYYIHFSNLVDTTGTPVLISSSWKYDDFDYSIIMGGNNKDTVIYFYDIDDPNGSTRYNLVKQ